MKKNVVIGILLFVLLVGATAFYTYRQTKDGIMKNAEIKAMKFDQDKINMYIFWGSTCPHCEELFTYLEAIEKDLKPYVRIYGFEVWENQANADLMDKFIQKYDGKAGSVPYIVIGDEVIIGFKESDKEKIKSLIKEAYDKKEKFNYNQSLFVTE